MTKFLQGSLAFLGLLICGLGAAQEAPPAYTVIAVEKMHCEGCAQRIGAKLQQVPGVKALQVDVAKKLFWVHPDGASQLSPRALWEAVEQGKDRPLWVQGPTGKYTQKPKS